MRLLRWHRFNIYSTDPECHFDGLETPEYIEDGCEECGGTGEAEDLTGEVK